MIVKSHSELATIMLTAMPSLIMITELVKMLLTSTQLALVLVKSIRKATNDVAGISIHSKDYNNGMALKDCLGICAITCCVLRCTLELSVASKLK